MKQAEAEASSRVELIDGTVLTRCDQCRTMYAERTPPGTPPCESCRVELVEENEDAAAIFPVVRWQRVETKVGGGMCRIDISTPAVEAAMRARGVKNQWDCLMRVRRLFYAMLEKEDAGQ